MLPIILNNRLPINVAETGDGGEIGQLRLSLAIKAANSELPDAERREAWHCLQALRGYQNAIDAIAAAITTPRVPTAPGF